MESEAKAGFSGAVLVLRKGEVVLDKAYGLANREKGIATRTDTVFAIGSTPIDFTKVGILLLAQTGELSLSDPLSLFFPGTARALLRSGLICGLSLPASPH